MQHHVASLTCRTLFCSANSVEIQRKHSSGYEAIMSELLNILLLFAPLLTIMVVANLAERQREQEQPHRGAAITSYFLMTSLYAIGIVAGVLIQSAGFFVEQQPDLLVGIPLQPESFTLLGLGIWVPSLVGILLLLPPLRRGVAAFTAIDPDSPVHAIALSFAMIIVIYLMFNLGIGLENLANMLEAQAEAGLQTDTVLALWLQQGATAILAMVGVGWLTRRSLPTTLARLGIVVPSWQQVLLGIGLGLGMVPIIILVEQFAVQYNFGVDQGVEELTEQLLGSLFTTPFGIFTVGAAAALGEETIFRGALQPRLGLILTSLLFALIHGNYGLSIATLIVFVVGLLLGYLRQRHNTTTSMLMHATYNITLALLTALAV